MVCAEQTIEEQKIKFDFYGAMEGHICGLIIYPTLRIKGFATSRLQQL